MSLGPRGRHHQLRADYGEMFPAGYPQLTQAFSNTLDALGLAVLRWTLCCLRRERASTDVARGAHSLAAVQLAGGWKRDSSMRRYQ